MATAHAWVDFLEGPHQGGKRVKLAFAQLERLPAEELAPAAAPAAAEATAPMEDGAPAATAADNDAAAAGATAPAEPSTADEWHDASKVF